MSECIVNGRTHAIRINHVPGKKKKLYDQAIYITTEEKKTLFVCLGSQAVKSCASLIQACYY